VPILPVFKHAKYVADEQLAVEKLAAQRPPLLKAGGANLADFESWRSQFGRF
jgi:hypothetical protein